MRPTGSRALLASHRDPKTFQWSDQPMLDIPAEVIPTDVPAWWMLKKKNAMFYNGFGRGDFSRFLMASNLLTVNDTSESREVDARFNDVLAYINSIVPPSYPKPVNKKLVREGGILFVQNCSKCHGSYGDDGKYPNLLIPEAEIQTDSILFKSNYQSYQFVEWFNNSWFAMGEHPARLEPFNGYIAPPLDGIWITAPYLHNGSVPDLECLLNSRERPGTGAVTLINRNTISISWVGNTKLTRPRRGQRFTILICRDMAIMDTGTEINSTTVKEKPLLNI